MLELKSRQLEHRRHQRQRLNKAVSIFWTTADGPDSCDGNCINVSMYGLLVEIPKSIPVGTKVATQIEGTDRRFEACVRHQHKYSTWHRIGLEFNTLWWH